MVDGLGAIPAKERIVLNVYRNTENGTEKAMLL